MSTAMIPFGAGNTLPAYLKNKTALVTVNKDVITGLGALPTLSIKGKQFTLVKDGERKTLMRPDDEDAVLQNINLALVRVNLKSRVYFAEAYVESTSERARPTCFSMDGVAPSNGADKPQAKKCQACPHAVWGSRRPGADASEGEAKGTACAVNTRIAVADPDNLDDVYLLRVPPASRPAFIETMKAGDARSVPYNAMVVKVGFDKDAPSPKLTFKPAALLSDEAYAKITTLYDDEKIKEIVGLVERRTHAAPEEGAPDVEPETEVQAPPPPPPPPAAPATVAAPEAKKPAPKPAKAPPVRAFNRPEAPPPAATAPDPAPAPAPAPVAAAPKKVVVSAGDDLMADMDSLLSLMDD